MSVDAPVGIVGLGLMGIALSARLIDAKIPLIGFDIDPVRCGMFEASGGMVANSVREKLAGLGMVVSPMPPSEFGAFIRSEITRWTAEAKAAGIEAK